MFRILVSGSRKWTDRATMENVLKAYFEQDDVCLIEGAAEGADLMSKSLYEELKVKHKRKGSELLEFPAKWKDIEGKPAQQIGIRKDKTKYWKAAGPARNIQMLEEGRPDIVLCFADDITNSKGTFHI